MTTTTHADFDAKTEAREVAEAFPVGIIGKTVLVTGVNLKGIGYTTVEAFASQGPAHVIVAGRNTSKLEESINVAKGLYPDVNFRPLQLDLSTQRTVRAAAIEVLSWSDIPTIDLLVNSAGTAILPERILNEDGIELTFATNYVGHFLFTCLIMPKLIKAAGASPHGATRIVNVTSLSPLRSAIRWSDINFDKPNQGLPETEQPSYALHRNCGFEDPEKLSYLPLEAYSQSKVGNLLFSIGLNQRLFDNHGILSLAVHPGIIATELSRHSNPVINQGLMQAFPSDLKTLGAGAATSLVAALDPKLTKGETRDGKENSGVYLADCQVFDKAHPLAIANSEAEKLWTLSENLVKQKFSW